MVRSMASKRLTEKQRVAIQRGISPSVRAGVIQRGRLAAMQNNNIAQSNINESEINKIVEQINLGKITSLSQIPEQYRQYINVNQSNLNEIKGYYDAVKIANQWDAAYKLADRVLSSKDPRAFWAIAFSDNPYAKSAYRDLKNQYSGYAQRREALSQVAQGKVPDVKIIGGRIRDLTVGRYITPEQASQYQFYTQVRDSLSPGERLIVDKDYNIKGIQSTATGQTYSFTRTGINAYNAAISNVKPKFDIKQYARELSLTGQSIKPDKKIEQIVQRYTNEINNNIKILYSSTRNNEIKRLKELQGKSNLSSSEKKEKKDLQKKVAKNYQRASEIIYKTIFNTLVNLGYGSLELFRQLKAAPLETLKSLPPAVLQGLKDDIKKIKGGELQALQVAVEYATLAGIFKIGGSITRKSVRALSKLNPRFVKFVEGEVKLRKNLLGKKSLVLKEQTVKSGAKSLSAQTRLAGKEITAVNASADRLTSLIKRKKIVRKPIPGEENFSPKIKQLLRKFDSGQGLTYREIATVNAYLRKNVAPNITLLERSLYADPAGGVRLSRLGITKQRTASLRDIVKGNFRLFGGKQRPQILIFENAKVARFPKYLKDVERKLKAGKRLTTSETNRLIAWQIKTGGGKFKPIGSTIYRGGIELEVTLAPGELIKRIKRIGFTYIDGVKVDFVLAEAYSPTKALLKEMKLAHSGKLPKLRLTKLENSLSKKLGRKIKVETPEIRRLPIRDRANVPVLRVRGSGIQVISFRGASARKVSVRKRKIGATRRSQIRPRQATRKRIVRKRVVRKPTPRKRIVGKRTARRTPRKPTPRKLIKQTPRIPRRPVKPRSRIPKVLRLRGYKPKKLSRQVQTYYVVTRKNGRFVRLYPKPLTREDARDLAVYSIDNNLTKTALFVPLGTAKQVIRPPKAISGYYSNNSRKVRPYRIKYGKKRQIVNGFIEKRRYFQDTRQEKLQAAKLRLKNRKIKKPIRKVIKRRVVRKRVIRRKSPTRRRKK